jgi:hypothetical protein
MVGIVPLDWRELNLDLLCWKQGYNSVMKPNRDSWMFNGSVENEIRLKPLCQQVEAHFKLPDRRLCRYFAVEEDEELMDIGKYYRGFHTSYSTDKRRKLLPPHLRNCFFRPPDETFVRPVRDFDSLIYIRASTCTDTTGFVTTYAHELQHFVQEGTLPRLSLVNEVLYQNLKSLEPKAITTDIPNERDANIVSKRVAESVCGVEAVSKFAEERIAVMEKAGEQDRAARDERDRWIFFRDVPSSTEYDYLAHTLRLVEKYRTVLDFEIDLNQPKWWLKPVE